MSRELLAALAEDLEQLIRLHDRELDAATVDALRQVDFPYGLAWRPLDDSARQACEYMMLARPDPMALDALAADFAAIYLNNRFGASPYESVWLTDDHLTCGPPMFELRECYAAAGWQVADWRQRFDDHLVIQLQFLQRQFLDSAVDVEELAIFIDEHIGYWFPDFAQRVSMCCSTAFYAALAELTHVWLQGCRALLAEVSGLPIPSREAMQQRIDKKLSRGKAEVAPIHFMPGGQGPSW